MLAQLLDARVEAPEPACRARAARARRTAWTHSGRAIRDTARASYLRARYRTPTHWWKCAAAPCRLKSARSMPAQYSAQCSGECPKPVTISPARAADAHGGPRCAAADIAAESTARASGSSCRACAAHRVTLRRSVRAARNGARRARRPGFSRPPPPSRDPSMYSPCEIQQSHVPALRVAAPRRSSQPGPGDPDGNA